MDINDVTRRLERIKHDLETKAAQFTRAAQSIQQSIELIGLKPESHDAMRQVLIAHQLIGKTLLDMQGTEQQTAPVKTKAAPVRRPRKKTQPGKPATKPIVPTLVAAAAPVAVDTSKKRRTNPPKGVHPIVQKTLKAILQLEEGVTLPTTLHDAMKLAHGKDWKLMTNPWPTGGKGSTMKPRSYGDEGFMPKLFRSALETLVKFSDEDDRLHPQIRAIKTAMGARQLSPITLIEQWLTQPKPRKTTPKPSTEVQATPPTPIPQASGEDVATSPASEKEKGSGKRGVHDVVVALLQAAAGAEKPPVTLVEALEQAHGVDWKEKTFSWPSGKGKSHLIRFGDDFSDPEGHIRKAVFNAMETLHVTDPSNLARITAHAVKLLEQRKLSAYDLTQSWYIN